MEKAELEVLTKKPVCVAVFGKPGCGKTTLSKSLSLLWKSHHIDGATCIEEAIDSRTDLGVQAESLLRSGKEVSGKVVLDIIKEKLASLSVANYGYVLDCLPFEEDISVEDQLTFVRSLALDPDVIVNLKIPDQDLEYRRVEQMVDPVTNNLFGRSVYRPTVEATEDTNDAEEDYDEDEPLDRKDDPVPARDMFDNDVATGCSAEDSISDAVCSRLVKRAVDQEDYVKQQIQQFNHTVLPRIEDFIISHDQQLVIELNGNLSPKELFKALLIRLSSMGLSRSPAPLRLVDPSEGDEEPEGIDNDQFLQQLSEINNLLPNFRWRRSRWGRFCPVELSQGKMVPGRMEFAVGFLDKMYSLSSEDALNQFMNSPRQFVLPPNPVIPCKICVVGPPLSGKSTLATSLAEKYNAQVLVMSELLRPVFERARETAVEDAKIEAQNTAINTISRQLAAQQAHQGAEVPEVSEDHPDVVNAVNLAIEKAKTTPLDYTQEMYMEALKVGITSAEEKRQASDPSGPKFGAWIVDGFPETRENWAAMIENNLLPDFVLSVEEDQGSSNFLLERFTKLKGIDYTPNLKMEKHDDEKNASNIPPEVVQWQEKKKNYDKSWGQLSASMKGSAIDPIVISCALPLEEAVLSAVNQMEDVFKHKAVEYSAAEDDANADDDPILDKAEGEDDGEESEEQQLQRKPWGCTKHFCPVALANKAVLWPGSSDIAARFQEKLYFFSSDEAKDEFTAKPEKFLPSTGIVEIPPLRVLFLGPHSSGKTITGRQIANSLGIYHISFRQYLQDEILIKMKKPPLVDEDDWEPADGQLVEQSADDEKELDSDVLVELNEIEAEIRGFLVHGEPLSEETIEMFAERFWHKEPFKSSGFIMEGFPNSADDMRILASKGLFTDCAVVIQVEESEVVKRILPGKMEIWNRKREKRLKKEAEEKEKRLKEWEEDKNLRKAELKAEYDQKVTEKKAESSKQHHEDEDEEEGDDEEEAVDEDLAEYEEAVAEIDQEEFPEEEDQEDEEDEPDARARLKGTITEKYEELTEALGSITDVLSELQIPCHTVNGNKKISVVEYSILKAIHPFSVDRLGLLAKTTVINEEIAKKLLDHAYKHLSCFKRWCPVQLLECPEVALPPNQLDSATYPIIHQDYIYFLSSPEALKKFIANPRKYLEQPSPGHSVPVRLAILGPPKSGKTAVANKFVKEYGCTRLSIGEALRLHIKKFPESKLTELMLSYLKNGETVPEDLCVHALENALLDVQCSTRGYVLDGWPLTKDHVDLLTKFGIIPVCLVELSITDKEMFRRADLDKKSAERTSPLHDSPAVLTIRSSHYHKNIESVKNWYSNEHQNFSTVDANQSFWWVCDKVNQHALTSASQIKQYLYRVKNGKAASISGLCITPKEFQAKLGEYAEYCPVSLALRSELVDCSGDHSLQFSAEFNGKYYKMSSQADLAVFMANPDSFVLPSAPRSLPSLENLPKKKNYGDIKAMFPKQIEILGFCPVTFVDGGSRYESLIPGCPEISVEYKGNLYSFVSEKEQDKFMRKPEKYRVTTLPAKLPPLKQPIAVSSLPMLGYLEQTVATGIINSLSSVGGLKPKFPFLSSTSSALFYVACHLKAFNPKSNDFVRNKYKKMLGRFEDQCSMTEFLSNVMKNGYADPEERSTDFTFKMKGFLQLKNPSKSLKQYIS